MKQKTKKEKFDSSNIRTIDDGASAYLALNMQVEFKAHRGNQDQILNNIKKEEKFKSEFGKDNVIQVRKGGGQRKVTDTVKMMEREIDQMVMYIEQNDVEVLPENLHDEHVDLSRS